MDVVHSTCRRDSQKDGALNHFWASAILSHSELLIFEKCVGFPVSRLHCNELTEGLALSHMAGLMETELASLWGSGGLTWIVGLSGACSV